jgi:hypothetical protein
MLRPYGDWQCIYETDNQRGFLERPQDLERVPCIPPSLHYPLYPCIKACQAGLANVCHLCITQRALKRGSLL